MPPWRSDHDHHVCAQGSYPYQNGRFVEVRKSYRPTAFRTHVPWGRELHELIQGGKENGQQIQQPASDL